MPRYIPLNVKRIDADFESIPLDTRHRTEARIRCGWDASDTVVEMCAHLIAVLEAYAHICDQFDERGRQLEDLVNEIDSAQEQGLR